MEIRILGAHNLESERARLTTLLVDGVLALEASSLTRSLSFEEQDRVEHILLTHRHYDHVRDIPALGLYMARRRTVNVYASPEVLEALSSHLLNGVIYPRLHETPPESPALRFRPLELHAEIEIGRYRVRTLPAYHTVPTWGFQVTAPEGKSFVYTGDTGAGFFADWQGPTPNLLIVEVTVSSSYEKFALSAGHLTPRLLERELGTWQKQVGQLPPVLAIHMSPAREEEIRRELEGVAQGLGTAITVAYEGLRLKL